MSQPDVNTVFSATDNFSGVAKKIQSNIKTLSNNFDDLAGALQDLVKYQNEYTASSASVSKATKDVAKASQAGVKSADSLSKALKKTGKDGAEALNKIDASEIKAQFVELNSGEIEQLSKSLKQAGSSLSNFMAGGKIDLKLGPAVAQLNELQKKLKKPITPISDFSSAKQAFQEMRKLNQGFRQEVEETFKSLTDSSMGADIVRQFEPINKLKDTLKDIQGQSGGEGIAQLLNFEEASAKSEALIGDVDRIKNRLIEIGPAARNGGDKAVAEFLQLSGELEKAQGKAEKLGLALKQAGQQFKGQTKGTNRSLMAMGFKKIKLNDIFPSSEQQKVAQLQQKINGAVKNSIDDGAVKKTLNMFLAQDRQIQSVDKNVVALTSHLPRLRYALYDVSRSAKIFGGVVLTAVAATVKVAADFERSFADVKRTVFDIGDNSNAATRSVNDLRRSLIDLSQDIPVGFADLAQIATLAGQLNVATEVVDEFTSTVARFSATTDVTIDATATAFGRLDQLVDGVNGQFEKLGSSILKVGVNAVATESDIIAISAQIASVANIAGFSAAELVGFSSALASVGTRPELARGTFTRLFTEIQQAVAGGGEKLDNFARIANQSSDEFALAWGAGSGPEQVIAILEGLNNAGAGADGALRQLGITSVRDVPTLLKLAQGIEEVKTQMDFAKIGFIEGTELQDQYSVITATLNERVEVLKNNMAAVTAAFGTLAGPVSGAIELLNLILKAIEFMASSTVGKVVVGIAAAFTTFVGVLALVVGVLAALGAGLSAAATVMTEMYKTTGLAKLQIDQLGVSLEKDTTRTLKNTAVRRMLNVTTAKATLARTKLTVATGRGTIATIKHNASLTVAQARMSVFRTGLIATTTRLRLFGIAMHTAARQTKIFGIAMKSLSAIKSIAVFVAISAGVEYLIRKIDELNNVTLDAAERFEDWGSILEAVKQDSRDFANATADNIDQFTVVGKAAGGTADEVSDYTRVLSVASGEEEALTDLLDKNSDAFDRQAIAIGKNTRAILAQRLAKELAIAAETPTAFGEFVIGFKANLLDGPSGSEQALQEINQSKALDALISTFGTELSVALQGAGFSYKEWSDAVISGNAELADSFANKLGPAAKELADQLRNSDDAEKFAEEIATFDAIAKGGTPALLDFAASNDEVTQAVRAAAIQLEATGGVFEDSEVKLLAFREVMEGVIDTAYAQVNADKVMSDSIIKLGNVFRTEGAAVASTSSEMQSAIDGIINSSESNEEAIDGLGGFYQAIVDGGYASAEQLEILEGVIIDTYRTAALVQIQAAKDAIAALEITKALAAATSRNFAITSRNYGTDAEYNKYKDLIAAAEKSIEDIDSIALSTGNAAEAASLLAKGYSEVDGAASGAADSAEDIADSAEKAVRTLLDYASDLEGVFDRAFGIRFNGQNSIDEIAEAWQNFTEQVEDAKNALQDLADTQADLAADRAIKEYFLSVAEAYDDQLRAAKLRAEISELDKEAAQNARDLADAQAVVGGATSLTGQTEGARANRSELLGLVQNYQDYIGVLAESGASQNELKAATEQARQEFILQARELGFAEQDILMYAEAFDDVRTAIDNIPRDITVDANVNPALQALNELGASLDKQINKANELSRALGQPVAKFQKTELTPERTGMASVIAADDARFSSLLSRINGGFSGGGFTGRGGKDEYAGPAHKGEFYIPKQHVNQSTGMPNPDFLAQLQNSTRNFAMSGPSGGGGGGGNDGPIMVELSPYDRKLLESAGNVQLKVDGKVLASSTNRSNSNEARRGSN
jgi:TP901 family phage tail tape measure protein